MMGTFLLGSLKNRTHDFICNKQTVNMMSVTSRFPFSLWLITLRKCLHIEVCNVIGYYKAAYTWYRSISIKFMWDGNSMILDVCVCMYVCMYIHIYKYTHTLGMYVCMCRARVKFVKVQLHAIPSLQKCG